MAAASAWTLEIVPYFVFLFHVEMFSAAKSSHFSSLVAQIHNFVHVNAFRASKVFSWRWKTETRGIL